MEHLNPVVAIVQQRVKGGETAAAVRAELLEKGYTHEQSDWIFSKVTLPEVVSKKSGNGFDISMIVLGVAAIILFTVTIPDYGLDQPRPVKDIEVPELADKDSDQIRQPESITLESGQTLSMYKMAATEDNRYQSSNKYDIDPYGVGVFGGHLGVLFNVRLNTLMFDGEPEICHLRDRYVIRKILPTDNSYALEVSDLAAERGHSGRIFSGCDELGEQYIDTRELVVVEGKVGYIGSKVVYPEDGWTRGTFNFDGKEYGSNIFKTEKEFLLNDEIIFVGYSDSEQGKRYLYKGNELIFSSSEDEGNPGIHPFKVAGKFGYVIEMTDTIKIFLDGVIDIDSPKASTKTQVIDLWFSEEVGYIALSNPDRILYFDGDSFTQLEQFDDFVRPASWNQAENNQTTGPVMFAVQRGGKTVIYRNDEIIFETEHHIRTNTITYSSTGDFAYTFNKKLYLNGEPLEGNFEKEASLGGSFKFDDGELLFSTGSIDTYAGETYSIKNSFEESRYYVNVYPYIIDGYPLFYVRKFGKRGEDVPTLYYLIYDDDAPWSEVIGKTVTNAERIKQAE